MTQDNPQSRPVSVADDLRRCLRPALQIQPPDAASRMAKTVGEGLGHPSADQIIATAVPRDRVMRLREESARWLRDVLRPEWIPTDLSDRLYAVRAATAGQDAFVGAWEIKGRMFQAVVTHARIHVLSDLKGPAASGGELGAALATASEILRIDAPLPAERIHTQPFGGLTLGVREEEFARNWDETLLFLTDGKTIKFSFLKFLHRTSPDEKVGAAGEPEPWFPAD